MKTSLRFSPEVLEPAVRLVLEHQREHESQWAAISSIAGKIGIFRTGGAGPPTEVRVAFIGAHTRPRCPTPGTLASPRGRRVRHPGMGGRVQSPPAAGISPRRNGKRRMITNDASGPARPDSTQPVSGKSGAAHAAGRIAAFRVRSSRPSRPVAKPMERGGSRTTCVSRGRQSVVPG